MKQQCLWLGLSLLTGALPGAQAAMLNSSFENGFSGWSMTEHAYIVTVDGQNRQRHSYLDYLGWEGADVWFNNPLAADGQSYAVFGSNGNESNGSATSSAWSATQRYLTFQHAGNNTGFLPEYSRAFAAIRDLQGNELLRVYTTSYNDSVWRTFTFDLAQAGLNFGDQFVFYYEDGYSWSVLDAVSQSGDALSPAPAPVSGPLVLSGLGLLALLRARKRLDNLARPESCGTGAKLLRDG